MGDQKQRKYIFVLVFAILFLSSIPLILSEVETLGTYKKGECIELLQSGAGLTSCNISSVRYPNSTSAGDNLSMTKDGTQYNYTFCSTNNLGNYIVSGVCANETEAVAWAYDFEITNSGETLNQGRSLIYIGLLAVLVFLFIVDLVGYTKLPSGNDRDEQGFFIGINKLKYLRPVLLALAWGILMAIVFTSSNIALSYLEAGMFGGILFSLFKIMLGLSLPIVVVFFIMLLINLFQDKKMKRMIERGAEMGNI